MTIRHQNAGVPKAEAFGNLELGKILGCEIEKGTKQGNVGLPSISKGTLGF